MGLPIRHLPLVQQWDCHGCTTCCRQYQVSVSDEERERILSQGWDRDPDIGDRPFFRRKGPIWNRRTILADGKDGACIFLSPEGRCRIHERFGSDAKPFACRLYPFVMIPTGDHWRVGLRFGCPSVAANKGGSLKKHEAELKQYAEALGRSAKIDDRGLPPPRLQSGQRVGWDDVLQFADVLLKLIRKRGEPIERRMRKCLALARLCRQARFDKIAGGRLNEFLQIISSGLESDVPQRPADVPAPKWVGRILFRQTLALFLRKDHGPNRGPATRSRLALFRAAIRFARGTGPVPQMNALVPEVAFETIEQPRGGLPAEAEEVLERYYAVKIESLQFCGSTNFRMPFWLGFYSLALTLPLILWVARTYRELSPKEAVTQAVNLIDDQFGFHPLLGSRRQRYAFAILGQMDELEKLIAWYSR